MASQIRTALYRVSQFFVALKAGFPAWAGGVRNKVVTEDKALLAMLLKTAPQQQLFVRMPPNDRRHALAVARTLSRAGYENQALLQAALLHDVGKSIGQPLIHRVLIVLLEAFWPAALRWLSRPGRSEEAALNNDRSQPKDVMVYRVSWWRRPFVVHAWHAAIGAAWAAEATCDPLAVALIARHQEGIKGEPGSTDDKLLAALQWADNLN